VETESGHRAQMVLIASVLLAVTFVGLALVVNSAIYTENLGTRDTTRSSEPISDHTVTQERLGRAIHDINFENDTAEYGPRHRKLGDNVTGWDSKMRGKAAGQGTFFGAEAVAATNGTRISQDTDRRFQPHGDAYWGDDLISDDLDPLGLTDRNSWIVAPDVRSRDYKATVDRSSLVDATVDLTDIVSFVLDGNDPFGIVFDEGGGTFRTVYLVHDDSGGNDDVAAVVTKSNATSEEYEGHCQVEAARATLRLEENELAGGGTVVDCPVLSFTDDLGRQDVYYVGSDNVEGTYDVVVDRNKSTFDQAIEDQYTDSFLDTVLGITCFLGLGSCDTTVYEDPGDGNPYTTWAIWNTTAELTYRDDEVRYSRNVTVPSGS
jgi:hypothetical protein